MKDCYPEEEGIDDYKREKVKKDRADKESGGQLNARQGMN